MPVTSTVIPTLRYRDAPAAVEWLTSALGFEARLVVPGEGEGSVAHAELSRGSGVVMLGSEGGPGQPPGSGSAYVVVEDPDAQFERAVAAGGEVVYGLTDQDYGSREFAVRDPEGNLWSCGTYRPQ